MQEYRPYTNIEDSNNCVVRVFDQNIDSVELKWHRDQEDRLIEAIEPTDWMFQLENSLPVKIEGQIFVPKYAWHRAIKGTGDLKIKIKKI